jgi:AraC-like DNA-binding protein
MSSIHIILIVIIVILALLNLRLKLRQPSDKRHFMMPERLGLHVSNNDIMHFLKDCTDDIKSFMDHRGIDFKMRCEPESMMGWLDTELLDRILILLLSDMAKHLDHGGKITIAAYTNQRYDNITLRISDNGSKFSDTGLLLIHYMVAFHRGTIRNEYFEKQGNTIYIELPIKKDAYETEQLESSSSSAFHIPSDIELHVPTIELPTGYEEGNSSLREIMQAPHSADQEFLRRAIQCVNEHLSDTDYDRQAFASDMGSSVSTLYNKIRALTGKNISTFTRDIRIKAACKLAKENPDLRVSDIAYHVGFRDPKYFATSFKRVTGEQPKEYFAKLRGEE